METPKPFNELLIENQELRLQLEEATDTIDAIRSGQVDALVVKAEEGHQLFTLKSADQTYRVFIEQMAEGAITLSTEGVILYCNSRFAVMMGLPLERIIGTPFLNFIADTSKDDYAQLILNGWKNDHKGEILLSTIDGLQKPCLLSCNTLDLDEGTALSIIITDLTVQKETQRQLSLKNHQLQMAQDVTIRLNDQLESTVNERTKELFASREHFKFLADNIPQMIWTNLPNGDINFYNKKWYEYSGLGINEAYEFGWRKVVHPDDLTDTSLKYRQSIKDGTIYEKENRYKRASDGAYRWHLNRGIPLKNESGEIILWIGTATDIEEQKQEMEKKDEFIGIASHELKTPLTSLKGYLQIMQMYNKQPLPPAIINYIVKANEAVNKLQYLVNDLLDVSKINAGRLEYGMSAFNIVDMVKASVENSQHIYPDYLFEIETENSVIVNGNTERLEQVLSNFISNAVKYSANQKKVIIKIGSLMGYGRVSVTDMGIGVSDQQKKKIFERFYRVEDRKYLTSGLGMGLYICTEIINAHHGRIGVDSELGKGSTFYFELPLLINN